MESIMCFSLSLESQFGINDLDFLLLPKRYVIFVETQSNQRPVYWCPLDYYIDNSVYLELQKLPYKSYDFRSTEFQTIYKIASQCIKWYVFEFSQKVSVCKNYGSAFFQNRSFYSKYSLTIISYLHWFDPKSFRDYYYTRPNNLTKLRKIQRYFRRRQSVIEIQRWWRTVYYANPKIIKKIGDSFHSKTRLICVSPF